MKVKVCLDTHSRRGKEVTVIEGLKHHRELIQEIATALKRSLGAGGTVKEGRIEIQGDQRQKVQEKLAAMGYEVG